MTVNSSTDHHLADHRLNDLLISVVRSLLQYATEAWPWSAARDAVKTRRTLEELATEQRRSVQRIVDLLDERRFAIDFDQYPEAFTNLNFVTLEYLLDQLVASQRKVVKACDRVARDCRHDPEAASLIENVRVREQQILSQLQELTK